MSKDEVYFNCQFDRTFTHEGTNVVQKPTMPETLNGRVVEIVSLVYTCSLTQIERAIARDPDNPVIPIEQTISPKMQATINFGAEIFFIDRTLRDSKDGVPISLPGQVNSRAVSWESVRLLDQTRPYPLAHLNNDSLIKDLVSVAGRVGRSGSGLVIDIAHNSNVERLTELREELNRHLTLLAEFQARQAADEYVLSIP